MALLLVGFLAKTLSPEQRHEFVVAARNAARSFNASGAQTPIFDAVMIALDLTEDGKPRPAP